VFRFTAPADPERHLKAAQILGADVSRVNPKDAGLVLADQLLPLMEKLWVPNGLKSLGFTENDIPELVKGALPQHRVLKLAPRHVGEDELTTLFKNSLTIY
jgi:hydroxyacid-oxoacid transhydrogenase